MNFAETTEQEVKSILREITIMTARYLNVPYAHIQDTFMLKTEIKRKSAELFSMLNDLNYAYWNFYYAIKALCKNTRNPAFTEAEKAKLKTIFEKKENYKRMILDEVTRIPVHVNYLARN